MVGIVIVSHSQKLAEGVVELAKMMAANAPVAAAGVLKTAISARVTKKFLRRLNRFIRPTAWRF